MQVGVERICNISTSLRNFSRIDSDTPVLFNMHQGLDSTIFILKHRLQANENRPAIEVVKDYRNVSEISGFPGQLNQVFMNILANAIDSFEPRCTNAEFARQVEHWKVSHPCIHIQTEALDRAVVIRIQDNGIGMSEAVKQKIFEREFTTKSVGKGTGLGLAIARQIIVEKHGGTISVDSELERGTEFILKLPIC